MNSPWPHLELPELDSRLQLIAGYLGSKPWVRTIVDLNCGLAPLLGYLGRNYFYVGNDRFGSFIEHLKKEHPHLAWSLCTDDEVNPTHDIDCLMCMGYAEGDGEYQSETIGQTVLRLAESHLPPIIILDVWSGYEKDHGPARIIPLLERYKVAFSWRIEPVVMATQYARRTVWILERQN